MFEDRSPCGSFVLNNWSIIIHHKVKMTSSLQALLKAGTGEKTNIRKFFLGGWRICRIMLVMSSKLCKTASKTHTQGGSL